VGGEGKLFLTIKTHPPTEMSMMASQFYQSNHLIICAVIQGRQLFSVPCHFNRFLMPQTIYSSKRSWEF